MEMKLNEVPVGKEVTIKCVSEVGVGPRLLEMGLTPGLEVEVLFRAPGGCPIAVSIGDEFVLGLRLAEAREVTVYSIKPQDP